MKKPGLVLRVLLTNLVQLHESLQSLNGRWMVDVERSDVHQLLEAVNDAAHRVLVLGVVLQ